VGATIGLMLGAALKLALATRDDEETDRFF
jgi:hypothetical protein